MTDNSKVAIVTGASKGIGAAIALRLARDGFAVLVNSSTDETAAGQLVDDITEMGGRAVAVQADVREPNGEPDLFETAETAFGPVNVLVNNAGRISGHGLASLPSV